DPTLHLRALVLEQVDLAEPPHPVAEGEVLVRCRQRRHDATSASTCLPLAAATDICGRGSLPICADRRAPEGRACPEQKSEAKRSGARDKHDCVMPRPPRSLRGGS